MRAVILAAGEGTRMRPLTENKPKVMLPIANKPMLEYIIGEVYAAGIRDITLVVGYKKESVEEYFGDGSKFGVHIDYIVQDKQMGTGHAFGMASSIQDERFIALNGDVIMSASQIHKLMHRKEVAVIAVKRVADPRAFGVIETDGGRVKRIVEKSPNPPTDMANMGIYMFSPLVFVAIEETGLSPRGEIEVTDAIQYLIDNGKQVGYELMEEEWLDIGKPWDLLAANEMALSFMKGRVQGEVEPLATLKGEVSIGKGTIVRNGAYIVGPVIIGDNCDIGPNCYIRPMTSIGNNVHIGNAVEIKNSIIMDDTKIGHLSYVGDSIIGCRCNFGAGTKIANLRLDERTIQVMVKGQMVDSGRRKLGVIMGDDVHTGIGSLINVGTTVGAGALIGPGVLIKGEVGSKQRIVKWN
ncbi:MAG TPA: bifunctional sugar-1-phosphate nucleotidylyltransferase/acetyltransferase [Methanocella sp.]|uniref:bifunctional sugar-1-phosphate nucleotidylyltransferase/acetyltransferase n=1 Tax=Methanocella sp. TaxID=2052833 RepID=UPI002C7B548B|nr:bifunctional sugar-1-phosphate nucleotidylyltransferase/acetyltransferase [Methanocella sp.]HTY89770.1 bifunctional sugar-1-phosphate nucleotidylyltransferase/acetyltransferase [Methanocella sp.]